MSYDLDVLLHELRKPSMTPEERTTFEKWYRETWFYENIDEETESAAAWGIAYGRKQAFEKGLAWGKSHCIHMYGDEDERRETADALDR